MQTTTRAAQAGSYAATSQAATIKGATTATGAIPSTTESTTGVTTRAGTT